MGSSIVFDVILFGIILTIYHRYNERKKMIREYNEQLHDYWYWGKDEGVLRKVGILRRLIDINAKPQSLININLNNARLSDFILTDMNFSLAQFVGANFIRTKFNNSILNNTDFSESVLFHTDFTGANLQNANLNAKHFNFANFDKADIRNAGLLYASEELSINQLKTVIWNSGTTFPPHIDVDKLEKINPSVKD